MGRPRRSYRPVRNGLPKRSNRLIFQCLVGSSTTRVRGDRQGALDRARRCLDGERDLDRRCVRRARCLRSSAAVRESPHCQLVGWLEGSATDLRQEFVQVSQVHLRP